MAENGIDVDLFKSNFQLGKPDAARAAQIPASQRGLSGVQSAFYT